MKIHLVKSLNSNCSQRTLWALNYKQLDYQSSEASELTREALLKISPLGKVPAINVDGQPLAESMAIIEFLEEICPEPRLLPQPGYQRAKVREICELVNGTVHAVQATKVTRFFIPEATEEQIISFRKKWIEQHLMPLQTLLFRESAYAVGNTFTLADIFVLPIFAKGLGFGMEARRYPLYLNHLKQCQDNAKSWQACPNELKEIVDGIVL